jgi:8-oxo-dGTP pyrophosphatase MutT (NUDIX family)
VKIIEHIRRSISQPLPGPDSQYRMAPIGRKDYVNSVQKYKQAAVLSLIYPKNEIPHMVFIQRTSHEKDKHSAQIAFPGGRIEKSDSSRVAGAIREAYEEVGVDPNHVNVLRELTPLKIPVSGYEVFPVLAFAESELNFVRQASEVERIIEISINDLLNPDNRKVQEIVLSSGLRLNDVPVFKFDDDIIWGATSMMLNEIIDILT